MASAVGASTPVVGLQGQEEIMDVDMEIIEQPETEAGRVGLKRARDCTYSTCSQGFTGVPTAEEKPTLQPHNHGKLLKKAGNANLLYRDLGSLAPIPYGNHRGSAEGSQAQGLSNLKEPLSKDVLYRNLINAYGEDDKKLARNSTILKVSQQRPCIINDSWNTKPTPPINELVQIPVNQENMGHHISLASDGHLDGRDTFPRFHLDGGKPISNVANRNSLSDPYVSRTYLGVNSLNIDHHRGPFDSSISFDSLHPIEKQPAYGRPTEDLFYNHQKEHSLTLGSYSSSSSMGLRNPGYSSSHHSLGSPPLQATGHLRMTSSRQLIPDTKKVGLSKDVNFYKGCDASSPALPVSSSYQPVAMSDEYLHPIKNEPWITSVPFVPSVSLADSMSPSNISCSISSQHTCENVVMGVNANKSLNNDDKLARNASTKGSNEYAGVVTPDRGHSCSLEGYNVVKSYERRNSGTIEEKTRHFRFHLAEHVKELLQPVWKEGKLSKDAHKLIVKKSIEKVLASLGSYQVPVTKESISEYITTFETKIEKLVKAYVDRHHTR